MKNKYSSRLNDKEWHKMIVGNKTSNSSVTDILGNNFPIWVRPLLNHSAPGDSLLEIGSGSGVLSAILGLYGRKVHLMDYSTESIEFSRKLIADLKLNANFICRDILKGIPLEDNSVDWIWSSGFMEHFSPKQVLELFKESLRVSRKGIMCLVPNANSIFYRAGKFRMENEGTWKYGREKPRASMRNFFEEVRLKNIAEYSVAPYHALNFFDSRRKEIAKFFDSLNYDELQKLNQGYLLFTYGEK